MTEGPIGHVATPPSAVRRGLQRTGLFFLLLVIWWAVNTHILAYGIHTTWENYQFALALSLFFGSLTAVPTVAYLFCADLLANKRRFPFNLAVFILLATCGGALLFGLDYQRGVLRSQTSEGWFYYYYMRFTPPAAVAGFLLVRQVVLSLRGLGRNFAR